MMKVTIKNTGTGSIDVPVSSLIAGSTPASALLAPDAHVDVVFLVPPTNDAVVAAVSTWAGNNGASVEMTFEPFAILPPATPPGPPPPPPPADPLGIG